MKITTTILAITLLITFALGQTNAPVTPSAPNQVTGLVTDSVCKGLNVYKAHTQYSCANDCVRLKNADYVVVVGNTIYTLEGNKTELEKFAGGRATINGRINGNTITVESIKGV